MGGCTSPFSCAESVTASLFLSPSLSPVPPRHQHLGYSSLLPSSGQGAAGHGCWWALGPACWWALPGHRPQCMAVPGPPAWPSLAAGSPQVDKHRVSLPRLLSGPPVAGTACHAYDREVHLRCQLTDGDYLVVPSTFLKDVAGRFLLRVFSSGRVSLRWAGAWDRRGSPSAGEGRNLALVCVWGLGVGDGAGVVPCVLVAAARPDFLQCGQVCPGIWVRAGPARRRVGDGAAARCLEERLDCGGQPEFCLLCPQPPVPLRGAWGRRWPTLGASHPAPALPGGALPSHRLPHLPGKTLGWGWGPEQPGQGPGGCPPQGQEGHRSRDATGHRSVWPFPIRPSQIRAAVSQVRDCLGLHPNRGRVGSRRGQEQLEGVGQEG